jgi:DNA-directed RNA polymerase subunit RPC12/RpoP
MSHVKCPYCSQKQEIDHDDGWGLGDGERYEERCGNCRKEFIFIPSISITYKVECAEIKREVK